MRNRIIFLSITIITLCCSCINKPRTDDANEAGKEYCECMSHNKNLTRDSASKFCMEKVAEKHRLLKIYLDTRDTIVTNLYDKKTVDEVSVFIASFSKRIYGCYEQK